MGVIQNVRNELMKKEIKNNRLTFKEPEYNYFVTINENNKDIKYFNENLQQGCASPFETTEEGTKYQILWRSNDEEGGLFYKLTPPIDVDWNSKDDWWKLSGLPGTKTLVNDEVIKHLLDNQDKCSEIIDMTKRLKGEVFGENYRTSSNYRDTEPWATVDEALNIENNKHIKK